MVGLLKKGVLVWIVVKPAGNPGQVITRLNGVDDKTTGAASLGIGRYQTGENVFQGLAFALGALQGGLVDRIIDINGKVS